MIVWLDFDSDCVSHLSKRILAHAYLFREKKNDATPQFISSFKEKSLNFPCGSLKWANNATSLSSCSS